jgi:hypothetical protein
MWVIKKIQGKLKNNKDIDVWHVCPKTQAGLFATFTDEKVALEYLDQVNNKDEQRKAHNSSMERDR